MNGKIVPNQHCFDEQIRLLAPRHHAHLATLFIHREFLWL